MKITYDQLRRLIKEAIISEANAPPEFTDDKGRHLKTGMVDFNWGKYSYSGKHSGELYYGILGNVQKKGDPFTYDKLKTGDLKVSSAPESGIKSIGSVVKSTKSTKDKLGTERLAQVSKENPCASATDDEILASMHELTLSEALAIGEKGKKSTKVGARTADAKIFGIGSVLGPSAENIYENAPSVTKVGDIGLLFQRAAKSVDESGVLEIQAAVLKITTDAIKVMKNDASVCTLKKDKK